MQLDPGGVAAVAALILESSDLSVEESLVAARGVLETYFAARAGSGPEPSPIPKDENGHRGCGGACYDCSRRYGDEYGFPDLVVPNEVWAAISPYSDEGGLLCPSCMVRRAWHAGLRDVPARFMSGPFCVDHSAGPLSVEQLAALLRQCDIKEELNDFDDWARWLLPRLSCATQEPTP